MMMIKMMTEDDDLKMMTEDNDDDGDEYKDDDDVKKHIILNNKRETRIYRQQRATYICHSPIRTFGLKYTHSDCVCLIMHVCITKEIRPKLTKDGTNKFKQDHRTYKEPARKSKKKQEKAKTHDQTPCGMSHLTKLISNATHAHKELSNSTY
jgi:hypothetical protein